MTDSIPSTSINMDQVPLMESPNYSDLEGEINMPQKPKPSDDGSSFDTLDEPVWITVRRDLSAVTSKFWHVLYPKQSQTLLKDWDLWGPLFICVLIALLLQESNNRGPQFTEAFIVTWFGACIVTLNIKLLGGNISFFQSLCVLGYCLTPCAVALIVCRIILLVGEQNVLLFIIRLLITTFGFSWATFASMAFLSGCQPPKRKALAVYPIFLFYLVVSWLIITQTHYGH